MTDNIVIVSGSRRYTDWRIVFATLQAYNPNFLRVGDCPTGVDMFALQWVQAANWGLYTASIGQEVFRAIDYKIHEADWAKYGRAAGPIRNHEMVDAGGDVLIAFPDDESRGTVDAACYAHSKGMRVEFPEMVKHRYNDFEEPKWYSWAKKLI